MPLFEYRCDKCRHQFTLLVGMTAKKAKRECPKCGGRNLTKLISRPARIIKSEDFDSDVGGPGGGDLDDMGGDFGDDDLDDE